MNSQVEPPRSIFYYLKYYEPFKFLYTELGTQQIQNFGKYAWLQGIQDYRSSCYITTIGMNRSNPGKITVEEHETRSWSVIGIMEGSSKIIQIILITVKK